MVRIDMITTTGALLTGLVIKARLASAAVTPAADHMMRALATSTTTTSSGACATEAAACEADATCLACAEAYDSAMEACAGSTTNGIIAESCGELGDIICCSAAGCEGHTAFTTFLACYNEGFGCGVVDLSTCAAAGGSGSDDTSPTTTSARGVTTDDSTTAAMDDTSSTTTSARGVTTDDSSTIPMDDTSSTTSDIDFTSAGSLTAMIDMSACPTELEACVADPECSSCFGAIVSAAEICAGSGYDIDTATCMDNLGNSCCAFLAAGDCFGGELMEAFMNCALRCSPDCGSGGLGCDDVHINVDCEDGGEDSSATGGGGGSAGSDDTSPATDTSSATSDRSVTTAAGSLTMIDTASCPTELEACLADSACSSCYETILSAGEDCAGSDYDPDTATCMDNLGNSCCAFEEAGDCFTEELMEAFMDCALRCSPDCGSGGLGCDDVHINVDCEDGGEDSSGSSGSSALPRGGDDEQGSANVYYSCTSTSCAQYTSSSFFGGGGDGDGNGGGVVGTDSAEEEEEDGEGEDADAAGDADSDSATPSAVVGGAMAMFVAAVVPLLVVMIGA